MVSVPGAHSELTSQVSGRTAAAQHIPLAGLGHGLECLSVIPFASRGGGGVVMGGGGTTARAFSFLQSGDTDIG